MPCAGVHNVCIGRIDGQRLYFVNLAAPRRTDLSPAVSPVVAAKYAFECSSNQNRRTRRRLHKGPDRLPVQTGGFGPVPAAIPAHPEPAAGTVQGPRGRVDNGSIGRIHNDVIDYKIVCRAQPRKLAPGRTAIGRLIDSAVRRAEVQMVGMIRNGSERPRIPAVGSNRGPGRLRQEPGLENPHEKENHEK